MIWSTEQNKNINKNIELIETTSGNTGILLAYVAASRSYRLILTMFDTMSVDRRKLLKSLSAKLILTDGKYDMKGAISIANNIISCNSKKYFLLKQFENPDNPKIHQITTVLEIWNGTNDNLDILISAVGTGETITGITRYIKQIKRKKI